MINMIFQHNHTAVVVVCWAGLLAYSWCLVYVTGWAALLVGVMVVVVHS